jgi:hypothetical protein
MVVALTPEQTMGKGFPRPVVVGDLLGLRIAHKSE